MTNYTPDAWILMNTGEAVKVLAGWKGGYPVGDEWRLSSGVVEVKECDGYWKFINHSGSEYDCGKHREGMIGVMLNVYAHLIKIGGKQISVEEYDKTSRV